MNPFVERVLVVVQVVAVAIAVGCGLAWFAHRTVQDQLITRAQVDRIERSMIAHRRYIVARDREWAARLGLPAPPIPEGLDP